MRKMPPPTDPVLRRIHELLPGQGTQIPTVSTARRVLKRVYEGDTNLNGHHARAILHLRDAGLVLFEIAWNVELRCQEWHVRLTPNCRRTLNRAANGS